MAVPELPVEPTEDRVRDRPPAEDPHHLRPRRHTIAARQDVEEPVERVFRDL
jgi:hypothetical protein